jgi:hypothetical protein
MAANGTQFDDMLNVGGEHADALHAEICDGHPIAGHASEMQWPYESKTMR